MTLPDVCPPALLPKTVHDTVRRITAGAHRRLEALPLQARLLSDDYRVDEYRSLLARTRDFYVPLAAELRASPHGANWTSRIDERIERLRADLHDLSASGSAVAAAPPVPSIRTLDGALGCMYVIEGSALGGRMISRHLARVFSGRDAEPVPLRFFTGDGEFTAAQWRAFCAVLERDTISIGDVCAAACATFDAFGKWLATSVERS